MHAVSPRPPVPPRRLAGVLPGAAAPPGGAAVHTSSKSGAMAPDRITAVSTAETKALIEEAVRNFQREVPALQKLKLVIELELRGRGDIQLFRVEVPGPKVTRDIASDAKVRLSVPRSHFNELADDGKLRNWREAFESGTVKASGPPEILRLIQNVVEKQEERSRTRKLRTK